MSSSSSAAATESLSESTAILASTTPVWKLISRNKWEAVRQRMGTHPSESVCPIHKPLHLAIRTTGTITCNQQHSKQSQDTLPMTLSTISPPMDIIAKLLSVSIKKRLFTKSEKIEILTDACYNPYIYGQIISLILQTFDMKTKCSLEFVYRLIKDILPFQNEQEKILKLRRQEDHHQYDYYTINALIQYWPVVLSITDKYGNLLLHHACHKAETLPIKIIQFMILNSIQNHLHYHSTTAASPGVGDDDRSSASTYIHYYHGGLLTMNRQQKTPLQNLCRIINKYELNNSTYKEQKIFDTILLLCHTLHPYNLPILHVGIISITKPNYFHLLQSLLEQNGFLTNIHHHQQKRDNSNHDEDHYNCDNRITHNTNYWLKLKDHNDKTVIEVAIQYLIQNNNNNNNTNPSNNAIACNTKSNHKNNNNSKRMNQQSKSIIQILTKSSSSFASKHKPNLTTSITPPPSFSFSNNVNDNRLVLHYACELGLSWDNGVEEILSANKNALEVVDEVTLLYPFMLAAASVKSSSSLYYVENGHNESEKQCDINVIYELLRRCPNIITTVLRNNHKKK